MHWQWKTATMGIVLLAWLFSGCEHVHEPWVQHPDQYQNERARSPVIAQELRHRLAHTQIDR